VEVKLHTNEYYMGAGALFSKEEFPIDGVFSTPQSRLDMMTVMRKIMPVPESNPDCSDYSQSLHCLRDSGVPFSITHIQSVYSVT
jgi:hypothetical protein